jgi:hypothetical protein
MSDRRNVKLPIHSKGKRASFYRSEGTDQLFSIVLMLTQELSVAYDRIETLERVLDKKGILARKEVEAHRPDMAEEMERTARRDAFIGRVFQIIHEEAESYTAEQPKAASRKAKGAKKEKVSS